MGNPKRFIADVKGSKFYCFSQNNSGGSFVNNDQVGHYVIIEATDADDANKRAEEIGIYFDGCSDGRDCDCCGDRWSPVAEGYAFKAPAVYGVPIAKYASMFGGHAVVYYLDRKEIVPLPAESKDYEEVPRA